MTAFTRTGSGLANARLFHQASFVVYVEGKSAPTCPGQEPPDFYYYSALMRVLRPSKAAKIKVVGNKDAAFAYAKKLRENNVKDSVVIVDKDLEDVTSSTVPVEPVIRTYGYSWENEIWSVNTASSLIQDLASATLIHDESPSVCLHFMAKRLRYLSALDAAAQVGGWALLPKNKSLCGVGVTFPKVSFREVKRISQKYRDSGAFACPVSSSVVSMALQLDPPQVIQGHFWSNVVQQYIGHSYRRLTNDTPPSKKAMLNLALSLMRRDAVHTVGSGVISRYNSELLRLGI